MKKGRNVRANIAIFLVSLILFSSCASTTMIKSNPSGAKLYLNEQFVGKTPYRHSDTKIVGSNIEVRLEKEGYETLYTSFARDEELDVGAIIGGVLILVPYLWIMKYKAYHTYDLIPFYEREDVDVIEYQDDRKSKAFRLRELKQLLDDDIITQKEFESEKKKILDSK